MRQFSPTTNLVLAVLSGFGLLASLTMPWFAAPVQDLVATDGPVERAAFQVGQVFATSAEGTVSGTDALGSAQVLVFGLVVIIALLAVAVVVPALRRQAEDIMRVAVYTAPLVVLVAAFTHPGVATPVRLHYGLLVSFVLTALMSSAAWHGANMRHQRAAQAPRRYGSAAR